MPMVKVSNGGSASAQLVKSPQTKTQGGTFTVSVSGYSSYILWLRAGSQSYIQGTSASTSKGSITELFKSSSSLSGVNWYAIYKIDANTTASTTLTVIGETNEYMVIGIG